jgi:hypothetical protein
MPESFDPDMFPGSCSFYSPALTAELHGDPVIGGETVPTVVFAPKDPGGSLSAVWAGGGCYVEPYGRGGGRSEAHWQPEVAAIWYVFTPTDPAAGADWLCSWNGRSLRVISPSAMADGWDIWRTECTEVI